MITARDLIFRYDTFQLSIPSLTIESGQCLALTGPSGSGKSTLAHILAGILPLQKGCINIGNTALHTLTEPQRRQFRKTTCGFMFQEFALLPWMTVQQNIVMPLASENAVTAPLLDRLHQLAQRCALTDLLGKKPQQLSTGEQQRAILCRALLHEPPYLIADEPTAHLDPQTAAEIRCLLLDECKRLHTTALIITHDHSHLADYDAHLSMLELTV